jgi:urease gamma subunit
MPRPYSKFARNLTPVQLTPRETEKLLVYVAADLARRRRGRGLRLNLPESIALITEAMLEAARDGKRASEVMTLGRQVLTRDDVMDEVPELLERVQVEATFPDGTKLVTCHDPIP